MSWTQREKETLVHLLQHPGWTITSISKEIGTKDVIEVGLSVEALRAKGDIPRALYIHYSFSIEYSTSAGSSKRDS